MKSKKRGFLLSVSFVFSLCLMLCLSVLFVEKVFAIDKRGFWRDACIEIDWQIQSAVFGKSEKGIEKGIIVSGYVTNIYQTPLEDVKIVVVHYDETGKVLSKRYVNVSPPTITPKGEATFSSVLADENYEKGNVEVRAEYNIKTDVPVRGE